MQSKRNDTAAIILAGGAGRRVHGLDKGLLHYQNRPMIEHVVQRIEPQVADTLISANRNVDAYMAYTNQIISDEQAGNEGPVAGIYAGLKALQKQPLIKQALICTCDTPQIPKDLVKKLSAALLMETEMQARSVAVASSGHRAQNLHCLIKREAWTDLLSFFDAGGRAMHRWHKKANSIEVDFSDQAGAFLNLNSLGCLDHSI